jgi:hypothetical protein
MYDRNTPGVANIYYGRRKTADEQMKVNNIGTFFLKHIVQAGCRRPVVEVILHAGDFAGQSGGRAISIYRSGKTDIRLVLVAKQDNLMPGGLKQCGHIEEDRLGTSFPVQEAIYQKDFHCPVN